MYNMLSGGSTPGQQFVTQYLDPYTQAGQDALPELQQQFMQLLQDPTAMMKQIGAGFQASPGYQYNVDQATQAAMQSGAASGMAGSPAVQEALAKNISGLASQDYNQYMQQALGQYGMGLQGEGSLASMGLQAGSAATQALMQGLMAQMQQQAAEKASSQGLLGGLAGAGTSLLTHFF